MEKTIEIERFNEPIDQITITQIDLVENSDDESLEQFEVIHRTSSERTSTVTSSSPSVNIPEFHKNDRHEIRVSWTNIPDKNNEHERDELVLYVQRNSRMVFAGVIEYSVLTDEYLKKLVRTFSTRTIQSYSSPFIGHRNTVLI